MKTTMLNQQPRSDSELPADKDPMSLFRGRGAGTDRYETEVECRTPTGVLSEADALAALAVLVSRYTRQRSLEFDAMGSVTVQVDDESTVAHHRSVVRAQAARKATAEGEMPAIGLRVGPPADEEATASLTVRIDPVRSRVGLSCREVEYPAWLVRSFGEHFAHVLDQLTDPAAQDRKLSGLRLQSADEDRAVVDLGRTPRPSSTVPDTIHSAFRRQARQTPEAVAIGDADVRIGYRELDEWTDRLSSALRDLGVERGDRVGVVLERSVGTVATLLAVLKAGAVYVPLETSVPDRRLAFVAEDCAFALAVVQDREREGVVPSRTVTFEALAELAEKAFADPAETAGPDDPAYIIYTSGSTGRPKGVVIPHRNVVSLLTATAEDLGLGSDDVWTWFHSAAFDFSVWEMWGCLLTGGRLVVVPDGVRRSPEDFRDLLRAEEVTVLNQTPSSFFQILELQRRRKLDLALRLIVFGGESLDTAALASWFELHPVRECRLVNMYGITETTVHVTTQDITDEQVAAGSRSVGRAIPGWSVRVLDERGRPVPLGAVGEIAVGGDGVAVGYLNRPELTAQRFVTDPDTGERLYLSGDCGRMLPDGSLEHLGRLDHQIKLRGHRIELGEIRSTLLEDPAVLAAAVVLHNALPGDPVGDRLDAYVVLAPDVAESELEKIRRRVGASLPAYMLPSTITSLPALPLTPNGKLDAGALPAPVLGSPDDRPVTEAEAAILMVWKDVLGVQVGPDEHFFDVGGNSLLAMRLMTAVREAGLGAGTVRDLYLNPTPRRLAAFCAAANRRSEHLKGN
jgi:amino acid adenylation domain-containing protein